MNILRLSTLSLITIMLIPLGAYAHCDGKHTGDHPHCSNLPKPGGGGDTGGTYSAEISGVIVGDSGTEQWGGTQRGVGQDSLDPTTAEITFDYFRTIFGNSTPLGVTCFGATGNPVQLRSVSVNRGKKGRAQASLWFEGLTGDGPTIDVLYLLYLTGKFDDGDNEEIPWPPEGEHQTKSMTMDTWTLTVEAQGAVVKPPFFSGRRRSLLRSHDITKITHITNNNASTTKGKGSAYKCTFPSKRAPATKKTENPATCRVFCARQLLI